MSEPLKDIVHGTYGAYARARCRCAECVNWSREKMQRWRASNREKARKQARTSVKKYRDSHPGQEKTKNDETRDQAYRHGYQWTGPELELISRDDLTLTQMSEILGRTYASVKVKRSALRVDPRAIALSGISEF